ESARVPASPLESHRETPSLPRSALHARRARSGVEKTRSAFRRLALMTLFTEPILLEDEVRSGGRPQGREGCVATQTPLPMKYQGRRRSQTRLARGALRKRSGKAIPGHDR